MDLRTKLVFALVAVSLVSLLALGAPAYWTASEHLTNKTVRQLNSLAETKKEDLKKVVLGWQDRVALIASRTQLRISLAAYNQAAEVETRDHIQRILSDASRSSAALLSLTVYDINGNPVASAGREPAPELVGSEPSGLIFAGETIEFEGIFFTSQDEPRASFVSRLVLEGQRVGALHVVLSAQDLVDVTQNFIGFRQLV